jgi:hypothetical protein
MFLDNELEPEGAFVDWLDRPYGGESPCCQKEISIINAHRVVNSSRWSVASHSLSPIEDSHQIIDLRFQMVIYFTRSILVT